MIHRCCGEFFLGVLSRIYCTDLYGYRSKHANHLAMLKEMLENHIPDRIVESKNLAEIYDLLKGYSTIASFLAFQYTIDLNYSNLVNFSEMSFVVPGPGAQDGIAKCFCDLGGLSETDVIKWVTERQEEEFERRGIQI